MIHRYAVSADILQFRPMDKAPNRIRAMRAAADLSQQALADAISVSKMTVSQLERGTMQLTLDYMSRIAAVFGVTPVDVLSEDDQNNFLRAEEMELVRHYRAAHPIQRELIHRVAETSVQWQPESGNKQDRAA